jgi:hypothetical protein
MTPELRRKVRLKDAVDVELADGLIKLKIAPTVAGRAFSMAEAQQKQQADVAKVDLFVGSCINEKGDPLFASAKEVVEFLDAISVSDATKLIDLIVGLSSEAKLKEAGDPGNSEGSP